MGRPRSKFKIGNFVRDTDRASNRYIVVSKEEFESNSPGVDLSLWHTKLVFFKSLRTGMYVYDELKNCESMELDTEAMLKQEFQKQLEEIING